jgi:signal transduction histidine kinase
MSRRALLIGAAGLLLGLGAERAAFGWGDARHWIPDVTVGWAFIGCGLAGWSRRPDSGTGPLLAATGFAWFVGNFASVDARPVAWLAAHALFVHRGPLVQCVLSFPNGRLTSSADRAAVALGYLAAMVTPIGRNKVATAVLGGLVVAAAVRGSTTAIGPARRSRALVIRLALAFGIALSAGALARLAFPSGAANEAVLLAYEAALVSVSFGILVGLLRVTGERTAVTDLVVELAGTPSGTLRDALAEALGDPTLEVGYRLPESAAYVDALGRPVVLPGAGAGRAVTPIEVDGRPVGVLVHDPAVLDDPGLLDSIASAARLAASNARLQAEVRAQVAEVQASRSRLVDAGDEERRRLERRLREGAGRHIEALAATLSSVQGAGSPGRLPQQLDQVDEQLERTVEDLAELARGLHPRIIEELGLAGALRDLARRCAVPIRLTMHVERIPGNVEAAAYFVCSEALSNLTKYSRAASGAITVQTREGRLVVVIEDDGVGGADANRGTGLRGLTDRVESLGGRLTVDSPQGVGTRLAAELPLGGEPP